MSRRREQRVPVALDTRGIESLPFDEIQAIIRAAEDLIARGGRTLLCKILKGSRGKDVLSRGLDRNPSWGFYRSLTNDEVLGRIDWTILHGYLQIEYFDRLPLLCYTPTGLEIEIDSITDELLARMRQVTGAETDVLFLASLKETPRATLWRLLEKIEATRDPLFIPALRMWAEHAYKKDAARIRRAIASLERST